MFTLSIKPKFSTQPGWSGNRSRSSTGNFPKQADDLQGYSTEVLHGFRSLRLERGNYGSICDKHFHFCRAFCKLVSVTIEHCRFNIVLCSIWFLFFWQNNNRIGAIDIKSKLFPLLDKVRFPVKTVLNLKEKKQCNVHCAGFLRHQCFRFTKEIASLELKMRPFVWMEKAFPLTSKVPEISNFKFSKFLILAKWKMPLVALCYRNQI